MTLLEPLYLDPSQNLDEQANQVAAYLNETNPKAGTQIHNLLEVAGPEFVQALLEETRAIEEQGGMMLPDGSRRRTVGGVFLLLAKRKLPEEQLVKVFPNYGKEKSQPLASAPDSPYTPPANVSVPVYRPAAPPVLEVGLEARRMALSIVRQLKDSDPERMEAIARLVQVGGTALAQEVLEITIDMETQGGLRKKDGTRRTPGGAFLYIASRRLTEDQRRLIWPELPSELTPPPVQTGRSRPSTPPATGGYRSSTPAGRATMAKITLIGRPGMVKQLSGYVAFQLESNRTPNLPQGLPMPNRSTTYTVYVAERQWARVASAAENPADALIIEGYPVYDAHVSGYLVYATNVSSRSSQQYRR
jgi:hypothetical protein